MPSARHNAPVVRMLAVGALAFAASGAAQALVLRWAAAGFFAVLVLPVVVGAFATWAGARVASLWGWHGAGAGLVAACVAGLVGLFALAADVHAWLPFHALYLALSWAWALVPAAIVAALLPPRRPRVNPAQPA